jgi:transcriptional regulator GlxA family with amidase domain
MLPRSNGGPAARARRDARVPPAKPVLDVTVVVIEGGYASTAIGPIEVFHSAGLLWNLLHGATPEPRFRVQIASIDGERVASACAVEMSAKVGIAEIERADIIVVASTGLDLDAAVARHARILPWLRQWHASGAYVAAVCTGVAFLAASGLLDGRQATTHWAVADALRERYPQVRWRPDLFVTEDDRVLCGGGVYAAIDLSLYLVEKFCGHDVALRCAKSLLVSMPRSRQSGYAVLPLLRPHCDDRIRTAEKYLHEQYNRDVSTKLLAELVGMEPRTFIRRFKAATGHLPGVYGQMLRMSAAKEMLEHGAMSVQSVCSRIGYEDVAHFRALFKRHTGMTPAEYRAHFADMSLNLGEFAAE